MSQTHDPPRQSLWAFLFVQRSADADAHLLVSTGAAHATAPATPILRSNSRRVIRSSSSPLTSFAKRSNQPNATFAIGRSARRGRGICDVWREEVCPLGGAVQ